MCLDDLGYRVIQQFQEKHSARRKGKQLEPTFSIDPSTTSESEIISQEKEYSEKGKQVHQRCHSIGVS